MRAARMLGAVALLAGVVLPLSSQGQEPAPGAEAIDPSQIPSVHNTFYKVPGGAIGWDLLGRMEVEVETIAPLQSLFHVDYSPEVKALDGRDVELMGFIYPLEAGTAHEHFLLTAWPPSCPFCLPAGPSQMVDVHAAEPVAFSEGAVLIGGRFEVLEDDPQGMYYRLRDARELERFEDIRWAGQLPQQPQAPE